MADECDQLHLGLQVQLLFVHLVGKLARFYAFQYTFSKGKSLLAMEQFLATFENIAPLASNVI